MDNPKAVGHNQYLFNVFAMIIFASPSNRGSELPQV
jgi:hypothetical protein